MTPSTANTISHINAECAAMRDRLEAMRTHVVDAIAQHAEQQAAVRVALEQRLIEAVAEAESLRQQNIDLGDLVDRQRRRIEELTGTPTTDPAAVSLTLELGNATAERFDFDYAALGTDAPLKLRLLPTGGKTTHTPVEVPLQGAVGSGMVNIDLLRQTWAGITAWWQVSAWLVAGDKTSDEKTITFTGSPTQPTQPTTPPIVVGPGGEPFPADGILRSGKTYKGEVNGRVLRLDKGARNVAIVGSKLHQTFLLVDNGNAGCAGVTLDGTEFTGFTRGMHGVTQDAIGPLRVTEPLSGMTVRGCTFRDFDGWGFDLHNVADLTVQDCRFINLRQGFHLEGMLGFCRVLRNEFAGIGRMAVEIQDQWVRDDRLKELTVAWNILHGFRSPDHYSYGLSVIAEMCRKTLVENNWLNFAYTGTLRIVDGLNGMGIGIELGGDNPISRNNVLVMPHNRMAVAHGTSGRNTAVLNDTIYGEQPGRDGQRWKQTQASRIYGQGSFNQYAIAHKALNEAPTASAWQQRMAEANQ